MEKGVKKALVEYKQCGNSELDDLGYEDSNFNMLELEYIKKEINFDRLLNKYGPEGLYLISDELKRVADKDMEEGLKL